MYDTKLDLNNNCLYIDQFEDISIYIKKNGTYISEVSKRNCLLKYLQDYINNIKPKKILLDPPKNKPEEGDETLFYKKKYLKQKTKLKN